MKTALAVLFIFLLISVPSLGSTKDEMTPTDSGIAHRDIGKVMVKVSPVKGNPLAQDFTLMNPELIFVDVKKGKWVPFFKTEYFFGGNEVEETLGIGPFAKQGMDLTKSRVSRKTMRIVYSNQIYYGKARLFLHAWLLGSDSGHGVWEAK